MDHLPSLLLQQRGTNVKAVSAQLEVEVRQAAVLLERTQQELSKLRNLLDRVDQQRNY